MTESHATAIDQALRDFGMWLTNRSTRASRAKALAGDGATAEEITAVCEFVERSAGHDLDASGKRLNLILRPGSWQDALQAARAAAARAPAKTGRSSHETNRFPAEPPTPAAVDQRTAGMCYATLAYDRKTPREAAELLGVSLADVPSLARAGAKLYGEDDPEPIVRRLLQT